jgi:hypothetical protein
MLADPVEPAEVPVPLGPARLAALDEINWLPALEEPVVLLALDAFPANGTCTAAIRLLSA